MSIQYHIYKNNSAGGAVDYTTPFATVAVLTWTSGALAASSDTTFAVRAFDTVTTLEDGNVDARLRVVLNAAQADVTARPNAPIGLTAVARSGGDVLVSWAYNSLGQGGAPTGFRVYKGTPTIGYVSVAATVAYSAGTGRYATTLPGLPESAHQVGVRAYNATGEEPNTTVVAVTPDATGPAPVGNLAAVVVG